MGNTVCNIQSDGGLTPFYNQGPFIIRLLIDYKYSNTTILIAINNLSNNICFVFTLQQLSMFAKGE